jgi:predicted MFS family arabinose efflux permease
MITRTQAWAMWFICSMFYAYQYVLRVLPSIIIDDISSKFNIEASTFGQFSGVYYLGYALMHIPIGIMLDRFGARKIVPLFILLTVIGILPILFSENYIFPIFGRLIVGVGSSSAILSIFFVIRLAFNEIHFTRMLSLAVTIGLIGAIYGGKPIYYLKTLYGYENILICLIVIGMLLSIVSFIVLPKTKNKQNHQGILVHTQKIFNWKFMLVCLFSGLMVGPLEGFADVWGVAFLNIVYGFEQNIAASLPSLIFLGMCFGSPILNICAARLNCYYSTIICSAVIMGASFIVMLNFQLSISVLSLLMVVIGVLSSYQIIAIYKASTYVRKEGIGLATAVANMIIMLFGYAFHTFIGNIITIYSSNTAFANQRAFIYGISVIPIALFIAAIGFVILVLQERRCLKSLPQTS